MSLHLLLLCNKPKEGNNANATLDHIEAIEQYSKHTVWTYSNLGDFSKVLDLNKFDVIVIHYSLGLYTNYHIPLKSKKKLSAFKGLKVVIAQDEYRQINKMIAALQFLNIDILFTCFSESEMEKIYPKSLLPTLSLYTNLTGYLTERLLKQTHLPLMKERPLHVGYRGRKSPFWFGELAYEKWDIIEKWKSIVKNKAIKTDISYREQDRIYGQEWIAFIVSCKATLGVESGASVMDFTGELERQVDAHQRANPEDDFYTVQALFFKEQEGKYKLNQISPRCFEAIALKTVLVLYEGEYSGLLTPERHYIMLKKDFSNIHEVIEKLLDDDYLQNTAETAYKEIALNPEYSYKTYIEKFDTLIEQGFSRLTIKKVDKPYQKKAFETIINRFSFTKEAYKLYNKLPCRLRLTLRALLKKASPMDL